MDRQFYPKPKRGISSRSVALLLILLLVPTFALLRLAQAFDPRLISAYLFGVSLVTYLLYRQDKRTAESGGWRTPESTLHLVEVLGGWPIAFLAQRSLRHKISKLRYQVAFWSIVLIHEIVCLDFLQDWKLAKRASLLLQQ